MTNELIRAIMDKVEASTTVVLTEEEQAELLAVLRCELEFCEDEAELLSAEDLQWVMGERDEL